MPNFDVNMIKTSEPVVIDVVAADLKDAKAGAIDICMAGVPELDKSFEKGRIDIDVKR